jgi:outer membrane receptor protein involved in Fe transport
LLITAGAQAQTVIEEIVVTATKRGEVSIQDVVGGISAVSGESLETYNLSSLNDYAKLIPSLQFATEGVGDSQLIIRGIQSPGAGTVGVYYDEAVMTGSNFQDGSGRTPDIRLHDVERLEVLKGPQGTLFGASSMSGTVRIITNKPDPKAFDAAASVTGMGTEDGDPGYQLSAMVNVPLTPTLAVRGVAWRDDLGGFIDHFAGVNAALEFDDGNDIEVNGGRVSVRWTPNEVFTASAFGVIQNAKVDDSQAFSPVPSGILLPITVLVGPGAGSVSPARPGPFGDLIAPQPSREPTDDDTYMYGLTVEYDLGFGSLLGTANFFDRRYLVSFDTTPQSIAFAIPVPGAQIHQWQDRSILSMEARFASDLDGPFNFVIGGFYEEDDNFHNLNVLVMDPATGQAPCINRAECLQDPATIGNIIFARTVESDLDFYRVFGHFDFEIIENWTIGGGVAYFDGDIHDIEYITQAVPGSGPPAAGFIPFTPAICAFGGAPPFLCAPQVVPSLETDAKTKQDEVTFDASLSWQRTEDQLYYFRAASGFRPGGINGATIAGQFGTLLPGTFEPDTVLSVEGGAKTSWYDDRLTLNLAYFKMFWNDMQVPGIDPTGAAEFIANAAESEVDGVEVEIFARPTDQWFITFGLTWLDARLTQDQEFVPGIPADTPRGFDGDPIPRVPDWALSGNVEYTVPFAIMENVETVLRANFSYTDESNTFFNDSDPLNTEMGDYFLLDLNASFRMNNWEAKLFVTNVTDDVPYVSINHNLDGLHVYTVRPRSYGIQVSWHWE